MKIPHAEDQVIHALAGNENKGIKFPYINFAAMVTVQNNTVSENFNEGIKFNQIGNNGSGFWDNASNGPLSQYPLFTGPEVLAQNNTVVDNGKSGSYPGMYLGSASYGSDVTFDNNVVSNNSDDGIQIGNITIEYGAALSILNNDILVNGVPGIYFDSPVQNEGYLLVDGNNIAGNSGYGLRLADINTLGTFATVTANVISGWTDPGGVKYFGNGSDGIRVDNVSNASLSIDNNTVAENGDDGIDIEYVGGSFSDVVVSDNIIGTYTDGFGNTFGGNMYNGVYVYQTGNSGERLQIGPGNTISKNYLAGVYLDFFTYGVRVVDNDITGNADGVWASGTLNLIGHNNITGNIPTSSCCSGIHLVSYDSAIVHGNNIMGNASTTSGSYGMFNNDSLGYADARGNYWGDPSGPFHELDNPGGLGDAISHYVDFSDFLTSPASVPDGTPPTVVGSAMVPDTISWGKTIYPAGPNSNDLVPYQYEYDG